MHIKVHIPPIRGKVSYGYRFPSLKVADKFYTVPLESVMLQEDKYRYKDSEFDELLRAYRDVERVEPMYWIRHPAITLDQEWREIHYAEYARISNLMQKLNLLEISEHNKKVIGVGLPENAIQKSDIAGMNALYGIDILDELAESEIS